MKLYDQLLTQDLDNLLMYPLGETIDMSTSLNAMLREAVRYRIDNVATYYWQHPDASGESWRVDDPAYFPSLAPPHPLTWLEYEMNPRVWLDTGLQYRTELVGMLSGALVSAIDRREAEAEGQGHLFDDTYDEATVRWLIQGFYFSSYKRKAVPQCFGTFTAAVCEDGSLAHKNGAPQSHVQTPIQDMQAADSLSQHTKPFLLTFSFLSASNVLIVTNAPPQKTRKAKKSRRQYTPYRTLEIAPLREVLRIRNREREATGRRLSSVSITRGHFRTYRDDGTSKGLFGKEIYGTFWIPSHVRGRGPDQDRDREVKI